MYWFYLLFISLGVVDNGMGTLEKPQFDGSRYNNPKFVTFYYSDKCLFLDRLQPGLDCQRLRGFFDGNLWNAMTQNCHLKTFLIRRCQLKSPNSILMLNFPQLG
jgi:hypothetical protein